MKIIVDNPKEVNGFRVVQDEYEIAVALSNGETVMHWERGTSMYPILMDAEYCKISPVKKENVKVGDAVFCCFLDEERTPYFMVHRCTEIYNRDGELFFKIEGTTGQIFGWTPEVLGIAESTNVFNETKNFDY